MSRLFSLILFFVVCLSACKDKKIVDAEHIMREWLGKAIQFPDIEPTILYGKTTDTSTYVVTDSIRYKILIYIDSIGCTSCKIGLKIWQTYIEELNSKVDFLFYFQPKTENELLSLFKRTQFIYPVYIDNNNEINKLNNLPSNPQYQCFLLNHANEVILVGNPVHNIKLWELYKKIISDTVFVEALVTTIIPEQVKIESKDLQTNKTSEVVFMLKNTGTQPMIIQMVESSCECTVPSWEKQPINPDKSTEIKVKITPETKGYFNKTIIVHCNTKEGQILLKVTGMVE
jgi:hypothetical protein